MGNLWGRHFPISPEARAATIPNRKIHWEYQTDGIAGKMAENFFWILGPGATGQWPLRKKEKMHQGMKGDCRYEMSEGKTSTLTRLGGQSQKGCKSKA
jgi:hypothetical protein